MHIHAIAELWTTKLATMKTNIYLRRSMTHRNPGCFPPPQFGMSMRSVLNHIVSLAYSQAAFEVLVTCRKEEFPLLCSTWHLGDSCWSRKRRRPHLSVYRHWDPHSLIFRKNDRYMCRREARCVDRCDIHSSAAAAAAKSHVATYAAAVWQRDRRETRKTGKEKKTTFISVLGSAQCWVATVGAAD